jgi:hypothetical protein
MAAVAVLAAEEDLAAGADDNRILIMSHDSDDSGMENMICGV